MKHTIVQEMYDSNERLPYDRQKVIWCWKGAWYAGTYEKYPFRSTELANISLFKSGQRTHYICNERKTLGRHDGDVLWMPHPDIIEEKEEAEVQHVVTFLIDDCGDWMGIYLDGKLVSQDHETSYSPINLIDELAGAFEDTVGSVYLDEDGKSVALPSFTFKVDYVDLSDYNGNCPKTWPIGRKK